MFGVGFNLVCFAHQNRGVFGPYARVMGFTPGLGGEGEGCECCGPLWSEIGLPVPSRRGEGRVDVVRWLKGNG